ncbi:MAG: hypothetical protein V1649_04025 [Patescibacteria group bacterium]
MSLTKYLITMFAGTFISFVAWVYILLNIDPTQTSILGFVFFYASLGLTLVGLFSLIGFGARKIFMKQELDFRHVYVSFRQAVFISFILIAVLLLQSYNLFSWLNIILLIIALTALDFFLVSKRSV